jgi:hypothetical protein
MKWHQQGTFDCAAVEVNGKPVLRANIIYFKNGCETADGDFVQGPIYDAIVSNASEDENIIREQLFTSLGDAKSWCEATVQSILIEAAATARWRE